MIDTRFLDALASSSPTPGGGSTSAYAGALAAGLASMVASLTRGQKRFASVQPEIESLLARSESLRAVLTSLIQADMDAYGGFAEAQRLPRLTNEEREERERQMQAALRQCTLVPQRIAAACREVLNLCPDLMAKGNPTALSDVGVAALLAEAAMRGAVLQVVANLAWLKDLSFAAAQRREAERMVEGTADLSARVLTDVEAALRPSV
jgi:formiminotetrahydrofolate cyclodeaminase